MMNEGALHELPGGWVWTRLEDASKEFIGGGTPSRQIHEYFGGNIIWLTPTEVPKNKIVILKDSKEKITESGLKHSSARIIPKDSVLLTSRASIGYVAIAGCDVTTNQGFASFVCSDAIYNFFLAYWLWANKQMLESNATGTTFKEISKSKLRDFYLPLPPLPEQRAIVSKIEQLFSDLDNGIENFKKAQAQLKLYRQSVLKAACEGKLVPTEADLARAQGRDYEAADVLLARIQKERREKWNGKGKHKEAEEPDVSKMPTLPDGWIWVNIDQLSEVVRGASPRPAGDPKYFGGNIPWITVGEITKDKKIYLNSVENFVTEEGKKASRFIEEGTFLLTNSGATLGVPKITLISGCINDGSVALLGLDETLKFYLYFFLFTQTNKLRQINQGAAQPNLNTTIVKRIILPLPPLTEQRRIVTEVERRLSVCDKMEATMTESLQKAESLRQSILKKAFEGKLLNKKELEKVRKAPDWEPAEKLLERIRQEKQIKEKDNKTGRRKTYG